MKSDRVIILCDGRAERWSLPVPKHKTIINGEPLINRTVRLLKKNRISDIWITSHDSTYSIPGTKRFEPANNQYKIDQFWACRSIWENQSRIIFLYGDVYFSEQAIETICDYCVDNYAYFQRTKGSEITGKKCKEGFAFKVENIGKFKTACEFLHNDAKSGLVEMNHNLSAYLEGMPRANYCLDYYGIGPHGVEIDDETDDFDCESDVETWKEYTKKCGIGI
jgi:choline kinase